MKTTKALPKSRILVNILVKEGEDTPTSAKTFTFLYMPANLSFKSDTSRRVNVWRSAHGATFLRVVEVNDKTETVSDTLYSGRVQAGQRSYMASDETSVEFAEALCNLGCFGTDTLAFHSEEVKRRIAESNRYEARREFDTLCATIGLKLNKRQAAKVGKHFGSLVVPNAEWE